MALHVLLAHNGASFALGVPSFTSLEELRTWIARKTSIDPAHQILMTPRGKQVKLQTLSTEQSIFLYDRRILSPSTSSKTVPNVSYGDDRAPVLRDGQPRITPDENTLQGWQALFEHRRRWAGDVADCCREIVEKIQSLSEQIGTVQRGIAIAVENIEQHFRNLEPKYLEAKSWADQACEDQAFLLRNWNAAVQTLASIRIDDRLGQCLQGAHPLSKDKRCRATFDGRQTLQDYFNLEELPEAARSGGEVSRRFKSRVKDLQVIFEVVAKDSGKIVEDFHKNANLSHNDGANIAERLIEEVEVLVKKINVDFDTVKGLPDTDKSISQASKSAQLHTNSLLPSLRQLYDEASQLFTNAIEQKQQAMQTSTEFLQKISTIESKISTTHSKLANLGVDDQDSKVFEALNFATRIPSFYGSLLVECVKRQEWAEIMTKDSSSLVEEIATYKEEEARRRSKWAREMGDAIDLSLLDDMAFGIEVNVHSQKQQWPTVTRDNISSLVNTLKRHGDLGGALQDIEQLLTTLDAPSKQQTRRAKAFKNGSVHEATYGRTSLLLRGDDQVLFSLQSEKSRVEDKLKSAESRIRKLEDLLHRSSQTSPFSRPSSAVGLSTADGPTFERHATSPATNYPSALSKAREPASRPASVSRRFSMNKDPEEKGLAQRIVTLEAELMNEKAQNAELTRKAEARSSAEDLLRSQVREATSTKEDLLGNLEAQQREFDDERRLLHEENDKVRLQLDQLEDEFDQALDNREYETKTRLVEEELEQARRDAADEADRTYHQIKSLQDDRTTQQEQNDRLSRELGQEREEKGRIFQESERLGQQLEHQCNSQRNHHKILGSVLSRLSDIEGVPEDFNDLIARIEAVAANSAEHIMDAKRALETLRADNCTLDVQVKSRDDEISDIRDQLENEQSKVFALQGEIDAHRTNGERLQAQLDLERHEHAELQRIFAAGEVTSNILQTQLNDKQGLLDDLAGQTAQHEVEKENTDRRLAEIAADLDLAHKDLGGTRKLKEAQSGWVVEVSKMILSQHTSLERLLEQINLVVIREEGKMTIQKAPKASSASAMLGESMKRSPSGPMPTNADQDPVIEPEALHWVEADSIETMERRYAEFVEILAGFDVYTFNEAVYKRVKEIEHIARKWQKEARAYRDKSHRAQSEVHDRIALRNFKEGDLALFLPTRDQATKPWAAFNVGAPHCFLREQDSHNLSKRDWLIARISRVEERVVDLSKSINGGLKGLGIQRSGGDKSDTGTFPDDENPYELSDGLRWYLIDAAEEKPGAPINIGTGKVTVASANVDAKGSIRMKKASDGNMATKTLTRSLDSRRSSTNSKKGLVAVTSNSPARPDTGLDGMLEQSIDNAAAAAAASSNLQVMKDAPQVSDDYRPRSSESADLPGKNGQMKEPARNTAGSPSKSLKAAPSSPPKKSPEKPKLKAWDSLWSLDVNLESGKGKK